MKYTNNKKMPASVVRACTEDTYKRPENDHTFSVTETLKGDKEIILTRRHWNELERDVSSMGHILLGKGVHSVIEGYKQDNDIVEQTFEITVLVDGEWYTLRGTVDLVEGVTIFDHKTTGVASYQINKEQGMASSWYEQTVRYFWLLRRNGIVVKGARILVILTDWKKSKLRTEANYPDSNIQTIEYDFKDQMVSDLDEDIHRKLFSLHENMKLSDDEIVECSPKERWQKETTYAVKKNGRKTAMRVLPTFLEAEVWRANNKGDFIEVRKGIDIKCAEWCECNGFCKYHLENLKLEAEDVEF